MSGAQQFKDLFGESAAQLAAAKGEKPQKTRPKYVSLREDQFPELDDLARELMDQRVNKKRRITANSLIRIAVDALLAQRDRLEGDDEREIRTNYLRILGVLEGEEEAQPAQPRESGSLEFKKFQTP
uniref:chromosome segregation ATPase n=1 Tax=unclassified Streptomyces TaxID=2593676 RepID=UPI003F491948